ncbi:CsgE family curli-type amyloid fiber assembly protein [Photobacterium sp. DNB22_13_2]
MKQLIISVISATLLSANVSFANDNKPLENGPPLESKDSLESLDSLTEIDGIIIDRTFTHLGEQFYSLFSQKMSDKFENLAENLTIKERPTALSGSIMSVYHRQNLIYRTAISPGRSQIEQRVDDAIREISNYVVRWKIERYLKDTFDVYHDEI